MLNFKVFKVISAAMLYFAATGIAQVPETFIQFLEDNGGTLVNTIRLNVNNCNLTPPPVKCDFTIERGDAGTPERLLMINQEGFVGIGAEEPTVPFQVKVNEDYLASFINTNDDGDGVLVQAADDNGWIQQWRRLGGALRMQLNGNGNLGIGTVPRADKILDVVGDVAFTGKAFIGDGDPVPDIPFQVSSLLDGPIAIFRATGDYSEGVLVRAGGGSYMIQEWQNEIGTVQMRLGMNLGSAHLLVNGEVEADMIRTAKWEVETPDYVFEPSYELAPLSNVEAFIKENKHLPEIPSGKEFEEKGMDLATMNMRLLKKVEELTLYAIEQEKKIDKQEERLSKLENVLRSGNK